VLITHEHDVAAAADRVVSMLDGRVVDAAADFVISTR
jgi:ABC-type lipoprotein export system ATPase subunit